MEESEVPMEHLHEKIGEAANENSHHESSEKGIMSNWIGRVALTTAVISVLSAITSLMAGHFESEAMLEQIKASDSWSYYQAKGIKSEIYSATNKLLIANGKAPTKEDETKIEKYKKEQENIKEDAERDTDLSKDHLRRHAILARGNTIFQIAIAMAAIGILTRQKLLWYVSMALAGIGIFFLFQGLI